MGKLFVEEGGVQREAEEHDCECCGKKFLRRTKRKRPTKFCSFECYYRSRLKRVKLKCFVCGKEFFRNPSKLKNSVHQIYFCSRKCKQKAQSLSGNCPDIRPPHYGTGTGEHRYRDLMKEEIKKGCIGCSINDQYLLSVHHIDGNRSNNVKSNLEVVCSNCHTKRHLLLKDGQWVFRSNVLTPRDMINKL